MTDWYKSRVRERAYAIWEEERHLHGSDLAHWFRAEAELRAAWAKGAIMHEDLWAGVAWKMDSANFFLQQMQRALDRLRDAQTARAEAAGVTVSAQWETPFYANLDGRAPTATSRNCRRTRIRATWLVSCACATRRRAAVCHG